MKTQIRKETDPNHLREMLSKCESEIESLAYVYIDGERKLNNKNGGKIRKNAKIRADILNRLFELHFNASDSKRLSQINHLFEKYEKNMVAKHIDMYKKVKAIDNNFSYFYSHIIYKYDGNCPQLQPLDDDGYYGSNWSEMLNIIDRFCLIDNEIFECIGEGRTSYDDGWRESINDDYPIKLDINPCYTFWELVNWHDYSIPDVLQMSPYKFCHDAWAMAEYDAF